ncbi:MAG: EAL domain-containing protein [Pseudomonadota bacterium]
MRFDLQTGSLLRALQGAWSLDGLFKVLDPQSPERLRLGLEAGAVAVNCALNLADGQPFELVGAFRDQDEAVGTVIVDPLVSEGVKEALLEPVFQPIISLKTRRIVGYEALARWAGLSTAQRAAARLNDDGLASKMILQSCEALSAWRAVAGCGALSVQINLSGRDLEHVALPELVAGAMAGFGLPHASVGIELTEQAALRDSGEALTMARALKEKGAKLILDDFGSGHSSFSWLADLPADGIKIDADLIGRLGAPRADGILRALASLCHSLDMEITAEGVEDEAQLEQLAAFGFDHVQGYWLGRPLSGQAVLAHLKSGGLVPSGAP